MVFVGHLHLEAEGKRGWWATSGSGSSGSEVTIPHISLPTKNQMSKPRDRGVMYNLVARNIILMG